MGDELTKQRWDRAEEVRAKRVEAEALEVENFPETFAAIARQRAAVTAWHENIGQRHDEFMIAIKEQTKAFERIATALERKV